MRWLSIIRMHLLMWQSTPMAALISLQTLQYLLNVLGYPAVALFILIESMGVPFPGETMLLLASFYAAVNHQLQIPFVIMSAAIGAIIGDNIGYLIGRTGGRAFALRFGKYFFLKQSHLDRAEKFFEKHGDKTVFFGRFFSILRTWSAFLAGVNHMHWQKFLMYNAAGGIAWAIIYGCIGYFAGRIFHDNFDQVAHIASTFGWIAGGTIVTGVIVAYIIYRIRRKRKADHVVQEDQEKQEEKEEQKKDTASPTDVLQ